MLSTAAYGAMPGARKSCAAHFPAERRRLKPASASKAFAEFAAKREYKAFQFTLAAAFAAGADPAGAALDAAPRPVRRRPANRGYAFIHAAPRSHFHEV
jgi:hypothetical protein